MRVGDRIAAELVGPGDLIQPIGHLDADEIVGCDVNWRALVASRMALLDGASPNVCLAWPQITRALMRRAARRARALNVQRAITAQPRLEVRLSLLLWHLAARWGKVEPGGIRLPIPLTHQLLGKTRRRRAPVRFARPLTARTGGARHRPRRRVAPSRTLDDHLAILIEPERSNVQALVAEVSSRLTPLSTTLVPTQSSACLAERQLVHVLW